MKTLCAISFFGFFASLLLNCFLPFVWEGEANYVLSLLSIGCGIFLLWSIFDSRRFDPAHKSSKIDDKGNYGRFLTGAVIFSTGMVLAGGGSLFLSLKYHCKHSAEAERYVEKYKEYKPTLEKEINAFQWSKLSHKHGDWKEKIRMGYKIALIDGSTLRLSPLQDTIIPAVYRPTDSVQKTIFIKISETWRDSSNAAWKEAYKGRVTEMRPMKYRVWAVQSIDPSTSEILGEATLHGLIQGVNFVNLFRRSWTPEEMEKWEKENCLPPTEEFLNWLGLPLSAPN